MELYFNRRVSVFYWRAFSFNQRKSTIYKSFLSFGYLTVKVFIGEGCCYNYPRLNNRLMSQLNSKECWQEEMYADTAMEKKRRIAEGMRIQDFHVVLFVKWVKRWRRNIFE